ncbi:MAG: hypothetical protein WBA17_09520 [Saprospiraceae bacterium]
MIPIRFILAGTLFVGIGGLLSAQQTASSAADPVVAYFVFLNDAHAELTARQIAYLQHTVHHHTETGSARIDLLAGIERIRLRVAQHDRPEEELYGQFMAVLETYRKLFERQFSRAETLLPGANPTHASLQTYLHELSSAEDGLARASSAFVAAQEKYAARHGIQLREGEFASEIAQLNALNAYQRPLYLTAFRLNELNNTFLDLIDGGNFSAALPARSALQRALTTELPALRARDSYRGETGFRQSVLQFATLLQKLADDHYPALLRAAEVGGPGRLGAAELAAYNAAIAAMNMQLPAALAATQREREELLRKMVPNGAARRTVRL